jgi:zinc protease
MNIHNTLLLPRWMFAASLALCLAAGSSAFAAADSASADADAADTSIAINLPFETFTLENGLRVVVHTDRKAPVVALSLWYRVGSKDELRGRSGFAHLFEHLMFQGSAHHPDDFAEPLKAVGATDFNGTTDHDRTNYFMTVPTPALDLALWMESDRMGHLLGALDQATLDEQRDVVRNEKREREGVAYGQFYSGGVMRRAMYPQDHPYRRTVQGSMADLDAATLDDARAWFKDGYGPNNAVLVLAGDIDAATARRKVERYFGDIPAGPSLTVRPPDPSPLPRDATSAINDDQVSQTALMRTWNVAERGHADAARLELFAAILGAEGDSRLVRRLQHRESLVASTGASLHPGLLGSQFEISATLRQGADPARVEAVIQEELQALLRDGPTAEELARVKRKSETDFLYTLENIGGFTGRANVLAACAVFDGDPGCFRDDRRSVRDATAIDVRDAGRRWLGEGRGSHRFRIVPGARAALVEDASAPPTAAPPPSEPRYAVVRSDIDRHSGPPKVSDFPEFRAPRLEHGRLSNGVPVVLIQQRDLPIVRMRLQFAGGSSLDTAEQSGRSVITAWLLGEGAGDRDALAFAARQKALGAWIGAASTPDSIELNLAAAKDTLSPSLELFADALLRPRFEPTAVARNITSLSESYLRRRADADALAEDLLLRNLFGEAHPYAYLVLGVRDNAALRALERDDVVALHREMLERRQAHLSIVDDTSLQEILPLLEAQLSGWVRDPAAKAPAHPAPASLARKTRLILVDRPGASQSSIAVGHLAPSQRDPGADDLDFATAILGKHPDGRLFRNLREDKGWTYGVFSHLTSAYAQRAWRTWTSVQTDKTADAVSELYKEVADWSSGRRAASAEEIERQRAEILFSLPARFASNASLLGLVSHAFRAGLPEDYAMRQQAAVRSIGSERVRVAASAIDPGALTWVVVGDLKQIEKPVRALKLGEVFIVDADGNAVKK